MGSFRHSKRSDNKRCTVEVKRGILIENLNEFFIPESGRKCSHTNSCNFLKMTTSQLELGRLWRDMQVIRSAIKT